MMQATSIVPSAPQAPNHRRFRSDVGEHLLVIPHTRIFDLSHALAASLDLDVQAADRFAAALGETSELEADLAAVVTPAPQSLSLNVSSSCNLSCGYCYADRGAFGGAQAETMKLAVAQQAVERLLAVADPSRPITIGFLGGEPLLNRDLVHAVVHFAGERAKQQQLDVRFSITTNGTVIADPDIKLFRDHRFAVTISIDGGDVAHNAQRPLSNGAGSFARLAKRVAPLLTDPGRAHVAARMTVRCGRLDLEPRLNAIWSLGFAEAGVSPLRVAADGSELRDDDWPIYRDALIGVARCELERAMRGQPIRLTNFAVALKQIHAGTSSPYACGAGGGYFSVAADGDWYACHRAVGDERYRLGSAAMLDENRRRFFLEARHVHAKADCRICWARYLCSGGCHQEAQVRSVASCDFVRDWLDFCLASYCELSSARPRRFAYGSEPSA
jgi:uncharacterized protein